MLSPREASGEDFRSAAAERSFYLSAAESALSAHKIGAALQGSSCVDVYCLRETAQAPARLAASFSALALAYLEASASVIL